MIQPKPLKKGGTIGIVALAGPMDSQVLLKGEALLNEMGFEVVIAPSCFEKHGYLAGTSDLRRAQDLMVMFSDDDIDAILCMRGGYGCNRILPYINQFNFSKYSKPFIGFSDITYLHIYFNTYHKLMTFHGPMIKDLLAKNELTTTHFLSTVGGNYNFELIDVPYFKQSVNKAEGELIGGNLSIICSTLGTPYEIDTRGKILFIEEINEPVYVIDRLMSQLAFSGKLEDACGIIFGDFNVYDKEDTLKLLKKMLRTYKKPVAYKVPAGHCSPNMTLPFGVNVKLDPSSTSISFDDLTSS
ncbi:MAG: S66 peptidase family protein [Turicibacter sp.]